jgi:membrane protein
MAKAKAGLARVRRSYPARLLSAYGQRQAGNYAAGLAFNAFMSMFPLLLGLLAILGLAIRDPSAQRHFESAVLGFFPADAHAAVSATLTGVRQHAGVLGIIGILGMLWSGSSLFSSMEFALGRMLDSGQRAFLRQRLMALGMTGVFVVAIVLSVAVNSVMAELHGLAFAGPVVGAVVWVCFAATIYLVVPNRRSTLADVGRGAVLAGLLMEVLTLLWPLYTGLTHGFNSYGSSFALFFLLATWLYFLSQFILLGAVANTMRAASAAPPSGPGTAPAIHEGATLVGQPAEREHARA